MSDMHAAPNEPLQPDAVGQVQPNAGLASLAHWSFLIGYGVPFASLIIPLVLLNTKGKEDEFVRDNATEALNLFLCSLIMAIISAVLILVVIGFFMLIAIGVYVLVFSIIAAIQTMGSTVGQPVYRYPLIFRLVG